VLDAEPAAPIEIGCNLIRLPDADARRLISTRSRLRLPANTVVATALALCRRAGKPLLIARQTLGESGRGRSVRGSAIGTMRLIRAVAGVAKTAGSHEAEPG
jgi:hypothetical protein